MSSRALGFGVESFGHHPHLKVAGFPYLACLSDGWNAEQIRLSDTSGARREVDALELQSKCG